MSPIGLSILLLALLSEAVPPPASPPPTTKDRLPPERMEALVAGPIALVRLGRIEAADAAFRALLARAAAADPSRRQETDLLTAYGVLLWEEGARWHDDLALRRAAVPWLRQAVEASRSGWGPRHPETAVALSDLADVLSGLYPEAIPAEAERAVAEAYCIRMEALGPDNVETRATKLDLDRIHRARLGRDSSRPRLPPLRARSRPS